MATAPASEMTAGSPAGTQPIVDSVAPGSVQSRTHRSVRDTGAGFAGDSNIFMTLFAGMNSAADQAPKWSYYPMYRDFFLRQFWKTEPILSGAIYSMAARVKALDYNFEAGPNKKKYWQNLADTCDGGMGIGHMSFKTAIDLLTQDNGAFWELVGAGDPNTELVGPVQDVLHIDAARCWRTFNPMYPVIYHSPDDGSWHRLHKSRVVTMSSMPQPDELARNIGFCGVSRALSLAHTMRAMHRYKYEKLTGTQPAILYGNGFNREELGLAVATGEAGADAKGLIYWNGIPVILNPDADAKVFMDLLSIKGLPDGFDAETDATLYIYCLALAFGVDAREFWPSTASGATKADASVQHMKAQGKGIADVLSTLERAWRQLLPDDVVFSYDFTDDEQDAQIATINQTRVSTFAQLVQTGIVNKKQAELHLVKDGVLDAKLMAAAENWVDPNAPQMIGPDGKPIQKLGPDGKPLPPAPGQPPGKPGEGKPGDELDPKKLADAAPSDQMGKLTKRMGSKDYDATKSKLVDNLTKIIQGGIDDDLTRRQLAAGMRTNLNKLGLQAFNDGLEKGGLTQESLSAEQLKAYREWQTRTSGYVTDFGKALYDGDGNLIDAQARAELWANKSLNEIHYEGVRLAAPHTLWTWRLGKTKDHCDDCASNNGQVKSMDEWTDQGLPQSSDLDCGGWYCDCSLEETYQ